MPLADCDGFFCRAGISEIEPGKSHGYVQEVVAQDCPEWQQTRHHDHCASTVSLRTAKTTHASPANQNPASSHGFATSGRLLIVVLEQPTQPVVRQKCVRRHSITLPCVRNGEQA